MVSYAPLAVRYACEPGPVIWGRCSSAVNLAPMLLRMVLMLYKRQWHSMGRTWAARGLHMGLYFLQHGLLFWE